MSSISNAPLQPKLDGAPLTPAHEWAEETASALTPDGKPSSNKDIASSPATTTGTGTGPGNVHSDTAHRTTAMNATEPASTAPLPPTPGVQGVASTATTPGLELPGAFPKSAMGGSGTTGQTDMAQTAKNALGTAGETAAQYGNAMFSTIQSYLPGQQSSTPTADTKALSNTSTTANGTTGTPQLTQNVLDHPPSKDDHGAGSGLAGIGAGGGAAVAGAGAVGAAGTAAAVHELHEHHEGTVTHAQSGTRHSDNEPLPGPGSDASAKDGKPAGVNVPQSGGLTAAGVPDDIFAHHDGKTGAPPAPPTKDSTTSPSITTTTSTPPSAPSKDTPTTQAKEQGPVTTTPPSSFTKDTSGAATSGQTPSKQSSKPTPPTVDDLDNANNTSDAGRAGGVKAKVADVKEGVGAKTEGAKDAAKSALPGSTGSGTGKSGSTGSTGASPPSPTIGHGKHDSSEDEGKKPGLMGKLQGKMKVLSGKLGRDKEKVEEGKKMQSST
ncbi:hypothetical protein BD410DRAFT_79553 [Rickenella mellea]|uniref:Uncharacterized protein n=1 Tax=Rickenella mellea TaxID=50990 RepID=A0A4Y7PKT5_9AGAM|nr:hypothetical protein BD410DRAFT_79553 [Rickenella mellea]